MLRVSRRRHQQKQGPASQKDRAGRHTPANMGRHKLEKEKSLDRLSVSVRGPWRPTCTPTSNRSLAMGPLPSPPSSWRAWQTLLRRISSCPRDVSVHRQGPKYHLFRRIFAKNYIVLARQERQDFPLAPSVVAPRPGSLALVLAPGLAWLCLCPAQPTSWRCHRRTLSQPPSPQHCLFCSRISSSCFSALLLKPPSSSAILFRQRPFPSVGLCFPRRLHHIA